MVMLLDQWRMGDPSPLKDRFPGLKLCGGMVLDACPGTPGFHEPAVHQEKAR